MKVEDTSGNRMSILPMWTNPKEKTKQVASSILAEMCAKYFDRIYICDTKIIQKGECDTNI